MTGLRTRDLLALIAGATAMLLAPALPDRSLLLAALPLCLIAAWWQPRARLVALVLLAACWVALAAAASMERRLDPALSGADVIVEGVVESLPLRHEAGWRFDLWVEAGDVFPDGARLRLNWYEVTSSPAIGSRWRMTLRLRPPRGGLNPGGFDFERHALERGLAATGTVRTAKLIAAAPGRGVGALRERLAERMETTAPGRGGALLRALAVGDRRGLDSDLWDTLRLTGTSHLMAISGLHVGLVAGFGVLLGRLLVFCLPALSLRMPGRFWTILPALPLAFMYAALAGFAVPTRRALLMLAVASLALCLRRHASPLQVLLLAACSVLLFDPLAVFGASYWLSVLGVAALILFARVRLGGGVAGRLLQAQGVLSLALLPFTALFFGMLSMSAPLANLIAVPWVGLVSVPVGLLGTALTMISPSWGSWAWALSAGTLEWLTGLLEWLARGGASVLWLPAPTHAAWLLAVAGVMVLLLPRGVPGRLFGLALLLPLLWPAVQRPAPGALRLVLLDVGQGTAVLVQTHRHALLYDTGPAYPGGYDAGAGTVVPALRALGSGPIDTVMVSHGDRDHAGGLASVRRTHPQARVVGSGVAPADACLRGQRWHWDGIDFEILHPPPFMPYLGNESSCVLALDSGTVRILLPGDVGALVETRLRREQVEALPADILLVPHHGSRSSSSEAFLDAVAPRYALVSAGWQNRFGHPAEDVVERYRRRGVSLLSTAECGAWILDIDRGGEISVRSMRRESARFWRAAC